MLTIIDDFSIKVWMIFLKQKSDVLTTFKEWKTMIERQTRKQVKRLCTDNGLEFVLMSLMFYASEKEL